MNTKVLVYIFQGVLQRVYVFTGEGDEPFEKAMRTFSKIRSIECGIGVDDNHFTDVLRADGFVEFYGLTFQILSPSDPEQPLH